MADDGKKNFDDEREREKYGLVHGRFSIQLDSIWALSVRKHISR